VDDLSESEYSPTVDEQLLVDSVPGNVSLDDSCGLSQSQSQHSASSGLYTLCDMVVSWRSSCGQVNYLGMYPVTHVNSAWPSLHG